MDSYFAVTTPGLETLAALELMRLGLRPEAGIAGQPADPAAETEPGGVSFRGDLEALYRANLHLRTSNRVLARLGTFFYAKTFAELREKAARLPWERFMQTGQPIDIRTTCHKSKLIHSDAVSARIAEAITERMGRPSPLQKASEDAVTPPQLIVVRVVNDRVTVSIDSSGELLHRRGYRQALAKAPLRETLAAAMILESGWDKSAPLLDPFCGSGTIPIEAAQMALGMAPGANREFAFMRWPSYDAGLWQKLKAEAVPQSPASLPPILASDRDAGAIRMAQANAERAGVAQYIQFENHAVSNIQPPNVPGWVVTNPPYGVRVSEGKDLRNLYAQFGHVLREHCPGWNVNILCNDLSLLGQTRLKLETKLMVSNGGIQVRLAQGMV